MFCIDLTNSGTVNCHNSKQQDKTCTPLYNIINVIYSLFVVLELNHSLFLLMACGSFALTKLIESIL